MPPETSDIKWPGDSAKKEREFENLAESGGGPPVRPEIRRKGLPRGIGFGIAALIIIFAGSLVFAYFSSRRFSDSVSLNLEDIRSGVEDLRNLDPESAEEKFVLARDSMNFEDIFSKLSLLFGSSKEAVSDFNTVISSGIAISKEVSFFRDNLPGLVFGRRGDELIGHLRSTRDILSGMSSVGSGAASVAAKMGYSPFSATGLYLPVSSDMLRIGRFLDFLIALLDSDSERHFLVMFGNTSEMRPGGGFLGSYADIVIKKGNIADIEVHDINDADKLLEKKMVPPKPLQAIVKNWRAADANWFFDFPDSAGKVLSFMEESNLYKEKGITFDGAVSVSPRVIGDILAVTGPVGLSGGKIKIDKDNFLIEIQKIVQESKEQRATYPKSVLGELSSTTLPALASLDPGKSKEVTGLMGKWLLNKDLIFFFKDEAAENFIRDYGVSGDTYDLPQGWNGDYLALVDANIGGDKTDLYMKQGVLLESQINDDGTVNDHLVITREHNGDKAKYWWYKSTNQDYLQVFVPETSQLVTTSGGIEKKITPPLNYAKEGYAVDPLVSGMEDSEEVIFNYPAVTERPDLERTVFATWSKTKPGGKSQIVFDYNHRIPSVPADGVKYKFIFEKQPGSKRDYKFQISAPIGYRFRENGLPVYEYESNDPPGRLILDLTLEKI